jgi:hypothetical protein
MVFKVTLRHYHDFGRDRPVVGSNLVRPEAWDGLRTQTCGAFSIPATRAEFVRAAETRPDIAARAHAIDDWLERQGARTVASYGVGGASLEWLLHQLRPGRGLTLSDYGQWTVDRVTELFPEARVVLHDLRHDGPLTADVHLFHRIDTELNNSEWRIVLERFACERVLIVAADVLDMRRLLTELVTRPLIKRRRASWAGYIRSRAALEGLWRSAHIAHRLQIGDLEAWELVPRAAGSASSGATGDDEPRCGS